jgi:NADPH-dependent 2,4-dienoyl-CoA reductase/sulfur reductase-like enzyme
VPASTRSRDRIERIAARAVWRPRVVLVVGAGPIGLPVALLAVQRGLEVHVLDRGVTTGPKPALVADLGASYHTGTVTRPPGVRAAAGLQPAGRRDGGWR